MSLMRYTQLRVHSRGVGGDAGRFGSDPPREGAEIRVKRVLPIYHEDVLRNQGLCSQCSLMSHNVSAAQVVSASNYSIVLCTYGMLPMLNQGGHRRALLVFEVCDLCLRAQLVWPGLWPDLNNVGTSNERRLESASL